MLQQQKPGLTAERSFHKLRFGAELNVHLVTYRKLLGWREAMSIKRIETAMQIKFENTNESSEDGDMRSILLQIKQELEEVNKKMEISQEL